jgi:hypothetical protein
VNTNSAQTAATTIRRALLAILFLGLCGIGAELVLLEHFEDIWQWVPVVLIALGLAAAVWTAIDPSRSSVRWLRAAMLLCALSGPAGIALHYRGNMEFQLESNPDAGGIELFKKVMKAKAPPALAPGAMLQLGLLGLVYTHRHPALASRAIDSPTGNP